jgi:hypothetical protein
MAKPFDATLNALIDDHVGDWARFLAGRCGVPMGEVTSLDTDQSATLQPDRLFRIDGPSPAVLHLELESTSRLGIPRELLRYNAFAHHLTELPVASTLVLLRPRAKASDQSGEYVVAGPGGQTFVHFRYTVIRVWQESVADLLAAGPGVAPLAILTDEAYADVPSAFGRFRESLRAAGVPDNIERGLIGSTFVLCGLRLDPARIDALYRSLSMTLEDSTTYQWIVNRGAVRGIKDTILRLGNSRFGPAPETTRAAIEGMTDRGQLERIADRLFDATGWDDLLKDS